MFNLYDFHTYCRYMVVTLLYNLYKKNLILGHCWDSFPDSKLKSTYGSVFFSLLSHILCSSPLSSTSGPTALPPPSPPLEPMWSSELFLVLTLPNTGGFGPIFQSALRGGIIGVSATKRFARSRIFRYGLPQDILSKRQKAGEGGAYSATPFRALKG